MASSIIPKSLENEVNTLTSKLTPKWVKLGGAASADLSTSGFTNITVSDLSKYILIRLNCSYYTSGLPDYGGATVSYSELKTATYEPITVYGGTVSYRFSVKYVNDTTLAIRATGTGNNDCISVHGIL